MEYSLEEILETVKMTLDDNFDIRTITLAVNLKDCIHHNFGIMAKKIDNKLTAAAFQLKSEKKKIEEKYGIPIVNCRISITPVSLLLECFRKPNVYLMLAKTLDKIAQKTGLDYIGGFGGFFQKGLSRLDKLLINSLPEVLAQTKRVCSFLNLATTKAGINVDAVLESARVIKETAQLTPGGIGCTNLVCFANAIEDNPFMAGAFCGFGEPEFSINVGISGPGVVKSVVEKNPNCSLEELSEIIKKTVFKITRAGELIGKEIAQNMKIEFGIVDLSLAPTTKIGDSVAEIIEKMGIERIGAPGTTAALYLLIDAVKRGGLAATSKAGGLSGTFIPVSEDKGMQRAVKEKALSLEKLEALTAVCSVGLDMIAIPGDVSVETIAGIISDELAIGVLHNKTTGVRLIPVPGKKAGQIVKWGGLLGETPIIEVNRNSCKKFLERKGHIPPPIQSFNN